MKRKEYIVFLIFFLKLSMNGAQTPYTEGKEFSVFGFLAKGFYQDYVIGGLSHKYFFNSKEVLATFRYESEPFDPKISIGYHEYFDSVVSPEGPSQNMVVWNRVNGFHISIILAQTSKAWKSVSYGIGGVFGWWRDKDMRYTDKEEFYPDEKQGFVVLPSFWVRKGNKNFSVYFSFISDGILPLSAAMGAVSIGFAGEVPFGSVHIGFLIPTYNLEFAPYLVYEKSFSHILLRFYGRLVMLSEGWGTGISIGVK